MIVVIIFTAIISFIIGYMVNSHSMLKEWSADVDERNKRFLEILKKPKKEQQYHIKIYELITKEK